MFFETDEIFTVYRRMHTGIPIAGIHPEGYAFPLHVRIYLDTAY